MYFVCVLLQLHKSSNKSTSTLYRFYSHLSNMSYQSKLKATSDQKILQKLSCYKVVNRDHFSSSSETRDRLQITLTILVYRIAKNYSILSQFPKKQTIAVMCIFTESYFGLLFYKPDVAVDPPPNVAVLPNTFLFAFSGLGLPPSPNRPPPPPNRPPPPLPLVVLVLVAEPNNPPPALLVVVEVAGAVPNKPPLLLLVVLPNTTPLKR